MFQKPSSDISLQNEEEKNYTHDEVETVVGPSVHVEGDFSSEGDILVKGSVSGNVTTSSLLTVEEGAKIFADVKAENAVISGEIKGNAEIGEKLELTSTSKIAGDINCKTLVVQAGALILGKVEMPGFDTKTSKKTKKKKASGKGKKSKKQDD